MHHITYIYGKVHDFSLIIWLCDNFNLILQSSLMNWFVTILAHMWFLALKIAVGTWKWHIETQVKNIVINELRATHGISGVICVFRCQKITYGLKLLYNQFIRLN